MAERYAVQNGLWSDTSTWDGGTLPDVGDDVHAGGFAVQMPAGASLTVKSLRTAAGSAAPAGGRFYYSSDSWLDELIITDGILAAHHQSGNASTGARTYILWVEEAGREIKITAPTIEGGAGSYRFGVGINVTGTATPGTGGGEPVIIDVSAGAGLKGGGNTLSVAVVVEAGNAGQDVTVLGNITGGTSAFGLSVTGGTVDITGDITGGTGVNAYGLSVTGGTVDITGDITGGTIAYGLSVTGGTVDITGDITGGTGSNAHGLSVTGGTVDITGDITGGTGSNAFGLSVTGGTVDITGDITGGTGSNAHGLITGGSSIITIQGGTIQGGTSTAHGVRHQSSQPITIHANITGGAAASNYGLNLPGAYTANITGTITGGGAAGAAGINAASNSTLNHTGDVTGSATHNAPGVLVTGATKTRINGTLIASEHAPAVTGENTIPVALKHAQNHPNGQAATQCKQWIIWDADDATWGVYTDLAWPDDPEGSAAVLTRFGTDLPAQADVRLNTTYGPGGNLTGTLEAGGASLADIAAVTGAQIQAATNAD